MKKYFFPLLLLVALGVIVYKIDDITKFTSNLVDAKPTVTIDPMNEYAYDNDYLYVQKSHDFVPYSRQDVMNIFYSIFDNGYNTFTFYCPSEYADCIKDVEEITNDQTIVTDIGNYVHPYNNFNSIEVTTGSLGQVDLVIERSYTGYMKQEINKKLDEIFSSVLNDEMDIHDKILAIHDYIIDYTSYDMEDSENSGNAYGALIEGKCKCSGYADAMALALAKLGIKNYKVASERHVWNALFIDDEWSQIDLTWDDPVVEDGTKLTDTIRHKFYMIDTPTLLSYDTDEHTFNTKVYREVK